MTTHEDQSKLKQPASTLTRTVRCRCVGCRRCDLGFHCNVEESGCHQDPVKWRLWMIRTMTWPRAFQGWRHHPPEWYALTGRSNAGETPDYYGAVFPDGTVVIRWNTAVCSTSMFGSWADFQSVHGHPEYGTRIKFHDGFDENGDPAEDTEPGAPVPVDARVPVLVATPEERVT